MWVAECNTLFKWIVSLWEEISTSTILNALRACFGREEQLLGKDKEVMEVNGAKIADVPELFEALESCTDQSKVRDHFQCCLENNRTARFPKKYFKYKYKLKEVTEFFLSPTKKWITPRKSCRGQIFYISHRSLFYHLISFKF